MTIAILPVLVETFATGSVAVVAGMAVWHLFKHEKLTKKPPHPENNETQAEASTFTPLKQDPPEETVSVRETAPVVEPVSAVVMESATEELDEQPMLKRHHLHNVRMMLIATTFPEPTDSMLNRHYDEMIDAKAEDCLTDENKMQRLVAEFEALQESPAPLAEKTSVEVFDEEPILKRHHLHNIRVMLMETTFPEPTDSMLSRHYDEMIDAKAEECLENESKLARLIANYEGGQTANVKETAQAVAKVKRSCAPEDSMLKRHFLSRLRAEIEKTKALCPTDSMLRRHYDAMINVEVENCLACH
jgi:hypothetical protein